MNLRVLGNYDDVSLDDRNRAAHRVRKALYTVEPAVAQVVVQLSHGVGADGRPRARCRVRVQLASGAVLRVQAAARGLADAIDRVEGPLRDQVTAAVAAQGGFEALPATAQPAALTA